MRRYLTLAAGLCTFFLVLFGVASVIGIPLLTDPGPLLRSASIATAAIGIALLIADVFLPVPSSLIMFAFGAAFGLWNGALLSMVGAIGASLTGFAIGRGGRDAVRRFVRDDEFDRAATLLDRWGTLALIATRPVPILAETTAILAGASRIGWLRMTILSAIGSAVPTILYAWAGSTARQPAEGIVVFLIVLAFSGAMWWIGRRTSPDTPRLRRGGTNSA